MKSALPWLSLSVLVIVPAQAALEYSVKSEAGLFRTEALEPPPLAVLPTGQSLQVIHIGSARSLVKTGTGLRGWMRNEDLLAIEAATGQRFAMPGQTIHPEGRIAISPHTFGDPVPAPEVLPPDRSFDGEIVEAMDREQVEMHHDEN